MLTIYYEELLKSYMHFQWNLSANGHGTNVEPNEAANVKQTLDFAAPLSEPVNVILYAVF